MMFLANFLLRILNNISLYNISLSLFSIKIAFGEKSAPLRKCTTDIQRVITERVPIQYRYGRWKGLKARGMNKVINPQIA